MSVRHTPVPIRLPVVHILLVLSVAHTGSLAGQSPTPAPTTPTVPAMTADSGAPTMGMRPGPLGIAMTRGGSGTSWLPESAPMHAELIPLGGWQLMAAMYLEHFGYDQPDGRR